MPKPGLTNLRPAPLFLRPSLVRALIGDVRLIASAVTSVPVLGQLADQVLAAPKNDEITRFDVAHEPASNDTRSAPTLLSTADRAGSRAAQAPAGTNDRVGGGVMDEVVNACAQLTVSDEPEPAQLVLPPAATGVSRLPDRSSAATARPPAFASGFYSEGETRRRLQHAGTVRTHAERKLAAERKIARSAEAASAADSAFDEFSAALARAKARREGAVVEVKAPAKPDGQIDPKRVAAAFAARQAPSTGSGRTTSKLPLKPALTREECLRCGIPGWKGCAHFLPCEDQPERPSDAELRSEAMGGPARNMAKFTGKRRGIGASRL